MTLAATPDPREERLPKWAQDSIRDLRYLLRQAEAANTAARLTLDPEGSVAVVDPYADLPIGLGNPTVRFRLGDERRGEWLDVRRMIDHRKETSLVIRGGGDVSAWPSATNSIRIEVRR